MLILPFAVAALAAPAPQPPAAEPLAFDLAGALARARSENPMLRAAHARVEERRGLITTTRADALPQVTLSGDFLRIRDVSILNSGISDMLAKMSISPDTLVQARNTYSTQAMVTQPLYHWGKIGTAIEIAELGEREAEAAFSSAELEVMHGVAKAYLAVLATRAELEVVESRKRTAEQFLADVTAKLEAQSATELDRLRAEAEYLGVLPEALQAEANHKRAVEVLNGQLGLDPRTPLTLAELGGAPEPGAPQGIERAEIRQLRIQESMMRKFDRVLAADLRPKFDFSASYGYLAGMSRNLFKEPYDTWRVTVSMRWPLFDGLRASGRRAQNAAQLEQNRQMRADKERAIAVERSSAERELEKARAFFVTARKAHDAGLEALRVSRESFEQGLITSLDLLQAERAERQMESQRRRAELGVWSALFDHRKALGLPPL